MNRRLSIAAICIGLILVIVVGVIVFRGQGSASGGDEPAASYASPHEEFVQVAGRLSNSHDPYLGTLQIPALREELESAREKFQPTVYIRLELARHLLRLGDVGEAIEQVNKAFAAGQSSGIGEFVPVEMHQTRALVYLRQAEVANCIERHNCDCCVFPLAGGGVHTEKEPAYNAKQSLLAILRAEPDNLGALWLLNIACMALGEYPDEVPEEFRIPPEAFESDADIGRFVDVAPRLKLDKFDNCGGVIVEDFDGDGFLDIVTSTYDPLGSLGYFHNLGNGQFEDRTTKSGLDQQLGSLNLVGADYDNDGDTDILVLRGAWMEDLGRIRNSLMRNNGDGTFTDVTRDAGMADPAMPTQAAVWSDFDGDGWLDLYVGNESRGGVGHGGHFPSQLFRNNRDGTFTDIAGQSGVTNDRFCKSVAAGDFDNDGDSDLYVSNLGPNRLYRNNGDGTFVDVAEELDLTHPAGRSFAAWFFDYNNDGWLDLFVAAYKATIGDVAADYLGKSHNALAPCLYRNNGDGTFSNVARESGLDHPYLPMGANFGDLDNDGWLDFYLGSGDPGYETLMPNIMLRNHAGQEFQDVTTSGGFGHLQKGHGVAFADIDNDGDQDIYHQLGGFYAGDKFRNALFRNPGHGNRFVTIKLVGSISNRAGYGARIRVTVDTPQGQRTIHRAVGSVSSFGGSPSRQEIGLADATAIGRIEIDWPGSGETQVVEDVPLDSMIRVTEDQPGFETIEPGTFDLSNESSPVRSDPGNRG